MGQIPTCHVSLDFFFAKHGFSETLYLGWMAGEGGWVDDWGEWIGGWLGNLDGWMAWEGGWVDGWEGGWGNFNGSYEITAMYSTPWLQHFQVYHSLLVH